MSEIWKPHEIKVYRKWIEDIVEQASDELNDWEISFLTNLDLRLQKGFNLTEPQAIKLEEIYVAKTN